MAFRLQDFECEDCKKLTEVLLDLNNLEEEKNLKCEHCGSVKLTRVLSTGTGNKKHISWSKWSV